MHVDMIEMPEFLVVVDEAVMQETLLLWRGPLMATLQQLGLSTICYKRGDTAVASDVPVRCCHFKPLTICWCSGCS